MSSSSGLMDTQPGGENTQYESINTIKPPAKERSNLSESSGPSDASRQEADEKRKRGEKTAANIRYGEAISEHGFGGTTDNNSGEAGGGAGYGRTQADDPTGEIEQTRKRQGYGSGSGVGG